MEVTFFGTRGSCPCAGRGYEEYGGNTSTGLLRTVSGRALIFDLGTGLRALGSHLIGDGSDRSGPLEATVLLSHLHFDHVLGVPFLSPLLMRGAVLEVYGPRPEGGSLADAFGELVRPPFFPLELKELGAHMTFHEVGDEELAVGSATVLTRRVRHRGNTLGFRVDDGGRNIAYVPDHQAPADLNSMDGGVLELADGVDLLVHDAQYTEDEFRRQPDWGHSTAGYAAKVASAAGARRLLLFHHDPSHDDRALDALESHVRGLREASDLVGVSSARDLTTIEVLPS